VGVDPASSGARLCFAGHLLRWECPAIAGRQAMDSDLRIGEAARQFRIRRGVVTALIHCGESESSATMASRRAETPSPRDFLSRGARAPAFRKMTCGTAGYRHSSVQGHRRAHSFLGAA
jgi:hypothetical protein